MTTRDNRIRIAILTFAMASAFLWVSLLALKMPRRIVPGTVALSTIAGVAVQAIYGKKY